VVNIIRQRINRLEQFLIHKVDYPHILPSFNPDIVLLDNRVKNFYGREHFYKYFSSAKKKVVLLPHGPHHGWPVAFTPFDEHGEKLPDYCEFWMPCWFDRSYEAIPEKKSQFFYVGAPALDSEWLEQLKVNSRLHSTEKQKPIKCLFIIRNLLGENEIRKSETSLFRPDYEEFLYYMNLVGNALKSAGVDMELIVKPHPATQVRELQALNDILSKSVLSKWRISQDSVYTHLPECDFVISVYSTVPLIAAMAGIPTVLLGGRVQTMVHQEDIMKQLYGGLYFYLDDPEDLPARLKEVIKVASERRQSGKAWQKDIEHLRYFYPDGAMRQCLDRLGL